MNKSGSNVFILKSTAAQRQLDAAIRMSLTGEDLLAITAVAAAGHRIIRDLLQARGRSVLADQWRGNMLGVARAILRGEVTEEEVATFRADDAIWPVIQSFLEHVRTKGPQRDLKELAEGIDVSISRMQELAHWNEFNRVPNFLKHADRDSDAVLQESDVNATLIITDGCMLFLDLMGWLTPEMKIWTALHVFVRQGKPPPHEADELVMISNTLSQVPAERRNEAALRILEVLKQE